MNEKGKCNQSSNQISYVLFSFVKIEIRKPNGNKHFNYQCHVFLTLVSDFARISASPQLQQSRLILVTKMNQSLSLKLSLMK